MWRLNPLYKDTGGMTMLPVFFLTFTFSGQEEARIRRKCPIQGPYRTNRSVKLKKVSDKRPLSDKQKREIEKSVQ